MTDKDGRVIKSYVWHGDKCFFVSTIERDSSACLPPPLPRYNETLVWGYDWETSERSEHILYQGFAYHGIDEHQRICLALFKTGEVSDD